MLDTTGEAGMNSSVIINGQESRWSEGNGKDLDIRRLFSVQHLDDFGRHLIRQR